MATVNFREEIEMMEAAAFPDRPATLVAEFRRGLVVR